MRTLVLLIASVPVAFAGSIVWWRLWMYQGLVGPPPLLKPFIQTDGEGSYDRVEHEMFIVLWVLLASAILIWAYLRRRRSSD